MDFNQFDSRSQAETGTPMQIVDQWSGKPMMDGDKPCRVIVRGTASKTVQASMREKQRAALLVEGKTEIQVMEDIHNQLCEASAPFIAGFENVKNGEKPATAADAEWFLNLTFPEMGDTTKDGEPVLDDEGKPVSGMINNPFSKQIGEHVADQRRILGNAKSG